MISRDESYELLAARVGDLLHRAEGGSVAVLPFLNPRDVRRAERALSEYGARGQAWFWGGYPGAERACLVLLPDYLVACLPNGRVTEEDDGALAELLAEEIAEAVRAVRVQGSGYRVLSHRDYLGSILGLGLERDALGDVAVQNEHEAVVFCSHRIAAFLIGNLEKVASDTVRCKPYTVGEGFTDGRRYRPISDTVASARLDCVVAALTNLSRDDAQRLIRTGLVEVDFEPEERVDTHLTPPTTLSVRGYGRFVLRAFDGETRKGRLRLCADQLI
jgi:RNA-binding protein YlmH